MARSPADGSAIAAWHHRPRAGSAGAGDPQDSAALLRHIDAANLFLVAADDERTSFRYHHLARQLLRAELRARDRAREQKLQLLAAEWFESTGDTRQAVRYLLAARQVDRALALLQDRWRPTSCTTRPRRARWI